MEIREYRQYDEREILPLYASVGWTAYTDQPETLRRGFENSLLTLAAYEENRLIGVLRAVGDGQTIVFVQTTDPAGISAQRRGYGAASGAAGSIPAGTADRTDRGRQPVSSGLLSKDGFCAHERAGLLRTDERLKKANENGVPTRRSERRFGFSP